VTLEPHLPAREVGEWLGLSTETVLRRHRRGEIPGYRLASNVLRFDPAIVRQWLDGQLEAGSTRLESVASDPANVS